MSGFMFYKRPVVSSYVFVGWIAMVYFGRIDLVPSFVTSLFVIVFYHNYAASLKTQDKLHANFRALTIGDIASMLLKGCNEMDPCSTTRHVQIDSNPEFQNEFPFSLACTGPEQNDEVGAKEGNLFKKNFEDLENRLQTVTGHIFHHYISRELGTMEPQKSFPEPPTKLTNPLSALSASFLEPVMKAIEVYILAVRGIFNALTWKDPFLSFWILVLFTLIMIILLLFPWRKFFYISGILCVGPQNFFLRHYFVTSGVEKRSLATTSNHDTFKSHTAELNEEQNVLAKGNNNIVGEDTEVDAKFKVVESKGDIPRRPLFKTVHSAKWQSQGKRIQNEQLHEIIIPYKRFDSERFYYWPPSQSPAPSNADFDAAEVQDMTTTLTSKYKDE